MSDKYDVIVVGAGHNNLSAAGFLAASGKRVLDLEKRPYVGTAPGRRSHKTGTPTNATSNGEQ